MKALKSILTVLLIIVACCGAGLIFTAGVFYWLTIFTEIPVDNNALCIGCSIVTGCTFVMLAIFALTGKKG